MSNRDQNPDSAAAHGRRRTAAGIAAALRDAGDLGDAFEAVGAEEGPARVGGGEVVAPGVGRVGLFKDNVIKIDFAGEVAEDDLRGERGDHGAAEAPSGGDAEIKFEAAPLRVQRHGEGG